MQFSIQHHHILKNHSRKERQYTVRTIKGQLKERNQRVAVMKENIMPKNQEQKINYEYKYSLYIVKCIILQSMLHLL